jgi:trehalose 6-phosphate phosphatase
MRPAAAVTALDEIRERIETADRIVVALDFDGTLAPICENPGDAAVPEESLGVLRSLSEVPGVTLAIVSGRSLADLKSRIELPAFYVGNHGLEIEGPRLSYVHEGGGEFRGAVDLACWDLRAAFQAVPGVLVEPKGMTATLHYRQAPTSLSGWIEATARMVISPYRPVLTLEPALKAWEVRPRVDWNKGTALEFLLQHAAAADPLLVFAGDDVGDEVMFDCRPNAISIKVGGQVGTQARYRVENPAELIELLRCLTAAAGIPRVLCGHSG